MRETKNLIFGVQSKDREFNRTPEVWVSSAATPHCSPKLFSLHLLHLLIRLRGYTQIGLNLRVSLGKLLFQNFWVL